MQNNSLLLVEPGFKKESAADANLLLKITRDSFSYAIIDPHSLEVQILFDQQGCQDITQTLKKAFEKDGYLQLPFNKIKAAVHTPHFLFVPDEWLDQNSAFNVSQFLGTDQQVKRQQLRDLGFSTLFSTGMIESYLLKETQIFPQSAPLLAVFKHLSDQALLIDFTANSFNVLYVKDKRVQFQNHFQAENSDEFNYFILLIIEQLQLNDSIPVYLEGIINEDDDYYNCLLKYFNQLYFFLPAGQPNSSLLADMPKHYFSGLLAINLCE